MPLEPGRAPGRHKPDGDPGPRPHGRHDLGPVHPSAALPGARAIRPGDVQPGQGPGREQGRLEGLRIQAGRPGHYGTRTAYLLLGLEGVSVYQPAFMFGWESRAPAFAQTITTRSATRSLEATAARRSSTTPIGTIGGQVMGSAVKAVTKPFEWLGVRTRGSRDLSPRCRRSRP
jgi:hypothetical protein